MKLRLSIRSTLAILLAVCLLPAAIVTSGLLVYSYSKNKQQQLENSLTMARTISHLVDKHFSNVEATLHALSTSPSLTLGDVPAFYWQAREALRTQKVANIVLTDRTGLQLMNTLRPLGETLPANGSNIRLANFGETAMAVVSDLFQGEVAGRPVVAAAVPVRRSDQILYGLSAGMSPDVFDAMLRQQELPERWISTLVDRKGIVVARTGSAASYVGLPISASLKQAIAQGNEGTFEGKTSDGVAVYSSFKRSETTGWTVVIGIPTEHIAGQLRHTLSGLLCAFFALFATAILAARLLGNRIAAAISALTQPAMALGEGKKVSVPSLPLAEADEVGKALMRASDMLYQARYQATHDALTGLANRALFQEMIMQQIALAERNNTDLSVLYIDLNRFKPVNDQYGHAVGDRLLVHVARQLSKSLRDSDLAARLGGDEFAVILVGTKAENASIVAAKILANLSLPVALETTEVQIGASIGIAAYPHDGRNIRDLLHAADEAMYEAKAAGENHIVLAGARALTVDA